ncbi:Microtubule-associated protein SPIRAL2-like [Dendrobium catenatum]|uniref:Microtubule-associated protein SPIRAL2-like n=1 Tax=Dendrobium catenatum TaxID=906689 RepID=A0A2I0VZ13_9ASPA|nr:Microtubule-associated protein SPIRAL2-like [Dendrobium catenatum]
MYPRRDRRYTLSLCLCGAGHDEEALNLLRKVLHEHENPGDLRALLLAAKICSKDCLLASEGIYYSQNRMVRHCIVNDLGAGDDKWEQFLAVVNEEDPPNMQLAVSDSIENQKDIMVEPSKLIAELTKIGAIGTKGMPTVLQGIHECLEIIDWATHKFAMDSLVTFTSYPGSLITNETSPIIESLEACCFDKMKAVRDSMMEALQVWRKFSHKGDTAVLEASMKRKVANFGNIENKIFDPGICLLQQSLFQ